MSWGSAPRTAPFTREPLPEATKPAELDQGHQAPPSNYLAPLSFHISMTQSADYKVSQLVITSLHFSSNVFFIQFTDESN